jgi:hypothetical protein
VYDRAGAPRAGSRGTKAQFSVSLQLTDGVWKVSQVNSNGADCTLPR